MMTGFSKLLTTEAKLVRREPATLFFALVFGPALITLFGLLPAFHKHEPSLGGLTTLDVYVPTVIVLALALAALNALPQALSSYRDKGYLRRMSTTPVSPAALLASQLTVVSAVSALSLAAIAGISRAFGVGFAGNPAGYLLALVLTALELFAIGLAVAALSPSSKVTGPVGAVLTFPTMFFAGLWVPRAQMPALLRRIGDYTPLGAGQHALQDAWAGRWPGLLDLAVMAAYAAVFGLAAARTFRWE
ncbi:MAG TPA: ABC transporter permease [Actinocrinis sp.]|nr:ABC transporter permease [Actinocrinis sp.]